MGGAKTRMLDAERERREKVLEELRLEFGYVINPEDNYMKGRISERERVLIKEEKEKKKQEKKEKGLLRKAAADAEQGPAGAGGGRGARQACRPHLSLIGSDSVEIGRKSDKIRSQTLHQRPHCEDT